MKFPTLCHASFSFHGSTDSASVRVPSQDCLVPAAAHPSMHGWHVASTCPVQGLHPLPTLCAPSSTWNPSLATWQPLGLPSRTPPEIRPVHSPKTRLTLRIEPRPWVSSPPSIGLTFVNSSGGNVPDASFSDVERPRPRHGPLRPPSSRQPLPLPCSEKDPLPVHAPQRQIASPTARSVFRHVVWSVSTCRTHTCVRRWRRAASRRALPWPRGDLRDSAEGV